MTETSVHKDMGNTYVGKQLFPGSDVSIIALTLRYKCEKGHKYKPVQYLDEKNQLKLCYMSNKSVLLQLSKDVFDHETSRKKQTLYCQLPANYHQVKHFKDRVSSIGEHNKVTHVLPRIEDLSNKDPRYMSCDHFSDFSQRLGIPNTPQGHFHEQHHQGDNRVSHCRTNDRPFIVEIKSSDKETEYGAKIRKRTEKNSKRAQEIQKQFQMDMEEISRNKEHQKLLDDRMLGLTCVDPCEEAYRYHRNGNNKGGIILSYSDQETLIDLIIKSRKEKKKLKLKGSIRPIVKRKKRDIVSFLVFPATPNATHDEEEICKMLWKPMKSMGLSPRTPFMISIKLSTFNEQKKSFRLRTTVKFVGNEAFTTSDIRKKVSAGNQPDGPVEEEPSASSEMGDVSDVSYSSDAESFSSGGGGDDAPEEPKFKVHKGKDVKIHKSPGMKELDPSEIGYVRDPHDGSLIPYEIARSAHMRIPLYSCLTSGAAISRHHEKVFHHNQILIRHDNVVKQCEQVGARAFDHHHHHHHRGDDNRKYIKVTWNGPSDCIAPEMKHTGREVVYTIGDLSTPGGKCLLKKLADESPNSYRFIYKDHGKFASSSV